MLGSKISTTGKFFWTLLPKILEKPSAILSWWERKREDISNTNTVIHDAENLGIEHKQPNLAKKQLSIRCMTSILEYMKYQRVTRRRSLSQLGCTVWIIRTISYFARINPKKNTIRRTPKAFSLSIDASRTKIIIVVVVMFTKFVLSVSIWKILILKLIVLFW